MNKSGYNVFNGGIILSNNCRLSLTTVKLLQNFEEQYTTCLLQARRDYEPNEHISCIFTEYLE